MEAIKEQNDIEKQIAECRKRRNEYMRLLKNIELMKLAYARSIAVETRNIAELKVRMKGESENGN